MVDDDDDDDDPNDSGPIEVPLTDVLDLHTFAPKEVASLVADYLDECSRRGFVQVRIIHGKGTGALRRIVHSVAAKHPAVISFALAGESGGGWGATLLELRACSEEGA
ncbi:MAG: Smr/MutS family protein [Pseudomonadota bacterium]